MTPDPETEHAWRELLQKQLADHWLALYYPEEKKETVLPKLRNPDGKVA
jgi:hypothetical protein